MVVILNATFTCQNHNLSVQTSKRMLLSKFQCLDLNCKFLGALPWWEFFTMTDRMHSSSIISWSLELNNLQVFLWWSFDIRADCRNILFATSFQRKYQSRVILRPSFSSSWVELQHIDVGSPSWVKDFDDTVDNRPEHFCFAFDIAAEKKYFKKSHVKSIPNILLCLT